MMDNRKKKPGAVISLGMKATGRLVKNVSQAAGYVADRVASDSQAGANLRNRCEKFGDSADDYFNRMAPLSGFAVDYAIDQSSTYIKDKFNKYRDSKPETFIPEPLVEGVAATLERRQLEQHTQLLIAGVADLSDAFMRVDDGVSLQNAAQLTGKIGSGSAVTAAMMAVARLFGTDSAGSVIRALSSNVVSGAAVSWLGARLASGSLALRGGTLAAGIGAYYGSKILWQNYVIARGRDEQVLNEQEKLIYGTLNSLLGTLYQLKVLKETQPQFVYRLVWAQTLTPMLEEIEALHETEYRDWPLLSRNQLITAVNNLKRLRAEVYHHLIKSVPVAVDDVAAAALCLMARVDAGFLNDEHLVDALRRGAEAATDPSGEALVETVGEDLGAWLNGLAPEQLKILLNRVRAYRELQQASHGQSAQDRAEATASQAAWSAEFFPGRGEPVVDIRLVHAHGAGEEVIDLRLSAATAVSAIAEQLKRFPELSLRGSEERAGQGGGAEVSQMSGEELEASLDDFIEKVNHSKSVHEVIGSSPEAGVTASFVTMVMSLGVRLRERCGNEEGESGDTGVAAVESDRAFRVAAVATLAREVLA